MTDEVRTDESGAARNEDGLVLAHAALEGSNGSLFTYRSVQVTVYSRIGDSDRNL
jgi:hypothetical protein